MDKKNTVPMLEKALDVLEYIGAGSTAVSLSELQENLGIAQASCYRIAATLVQRGWLEKCSGNRYEIAPGVIPVADKARLRLAKYAQLQPVMNRISGLIGFSAKFSVLDGDEFVNVCSAQCRSELLSFSEPGFRSPLRRIATVSAIFLAEKKPRELCRLLNGVQMKELENYLENYHKYGYCFMKGQTGKNVEYPFDTLSFPVRDEKGILRGVVSFLSLSGQLEAEKESIAVRIGKLLKSLVNLL